MTKKILSILLAVIMIFSMAPVAVFAEDDILSYLTYEITDGEVAITKCDGSIRGEVVIPDTVEGYPVTTVSWGALSECYYISSIYIPANLKIFEDLGSFGFSLEKFAVDENNLYFSCDENGVLYNKDKTVLIRYPVGKSETEFKVPDYVTEIADMAFFCATNLRSIKLPECITSVGEFSFGQCFRLKNINIPSDIKVLNPMAFYLSFSIESIAFPESVSSVYDCLKYSPIKEIYCYNSEMEISENEIGYSHYDLSAIAAAGESIESLAENAVEAFWYSVTGNGEPVEMEIGKYVDFMNVFPNPDFTIYGYEDSSAQTYAEENGFNFVALCRHNYVDTVITPATYFLTGVGGKVCEHCGDTLETYEMPMLEIKDSEEMEDKDTGVSVIFPEGTFEEDANVEIEVTPVAEGDAYKLISHKQGNYKVTMFDINITADGEKIQPNGTILVKIPLPKGYNQNKCVVYYVAEDGTMEELKTYHYKDGYVYFETNHFSHYAVVEDAAQEETGDFLSEIKRFFESIKEFFAKLTELLNQKNLADLLVEFLKSAV